jgi:hypothetical protein
MKIEDIGLILQHMDLKAESKKSPESPEDAQLRRFKEKWLFIITLLAITTVFVVCINYLILKQESPYTGIALNGVIGLAMALAGYYVRGRGAQ